MAMSKFASCAGGMYVVCGSNTAFTAFKRFSAGSSFSVTLRRVNCVS
jgi:hypothetical protein